MEAQCGQTPPICPPPPNVVTLVHNYFKVASLTYNAEVNRYKVKCGASLESWQQSGWIKSQDPYGWFQWYCRFYQVRLMVSCKLMRFDVSNRRRRIEISVRIRSSNNNDSDSNDYIESTISIFDIFSIKSTDFDTKLIKISILIDQLSII